MPKLSSFLFIFRKYTCRQKCDAVIEHNNNNINNNDDDDDSDSETNINKNNNRNDENNNSISSNSSGSSNDDNNNNNNNNNNNINKKIKTEPKTLCPVDKIHRNQCRHCRLQKCLEVNMNRDGESLSGGNYFGRNSLFLPPSFPYFFLLFKC